MKNFILFIAMISSFFCQAQNWNLVDVDIETQFNNIHFIDDNTGIIVGMAGTLLRTTDGGASWNQVMTGATHDLWDLSFVDENIGFANGLKTTDGGLTWTSQSDSEDFYFIYAINENHIIGNYSTAADGLYESFDGGDTWTQTSIDGSGGVVNDCYFVDENIGYLSVFSIGSSGTSSKKILKTIDGGSSWNIMEINAPTGNSFLNAFSAVAFPSEEIGLLAHEFGILKTSDGGNSWMEIESGDTPTYWEPTEVFAASDEHYIMVGIKAFDSDENAKLYETMDGGDTWTQAAFTNGFLFDATCTSNNCFAVGSGGQLYRKFDLAPTSTFTFEKSSVAVFPNPATDYLQIETGNKEVSNLEIIDVTGRRCNVNLLDQNRLDVSNLSAGIYFLKIEIQGQGNTYKFIKE